MREGEWRGRGTGEEGARGWIGGVYTISANLIKA